MDRGIHHLMTWLFDINLETQRNQYGPTTKTINTLTESTFTSLNMSLNFLRPPMERTAKVPMFSLHCEENNPTSRSTLNYDIVDELA